MTREMVPYLQAAHALFGGLLLVAFVYQGGIGWRNRRQRIVGGRPDFTLVRRHRALGPVLALLVPVAYVAGVVTAVIDHGDWYFYPLHLLVGTVLLISLGATVLVSRSIRGLDTPWRERHYLLALATLLLFFVQALVGLAALL